MPRYLAIAALLTLIGVVIIAKAAKIMIVERHYWEVVASKMKNDSISEKPNRGNILSSDGQLMASSIPEYKPFVDFQPGKRRGVPLDSVKRHYLDSLWDADIDSL